MKYLFFIAGMVAVIVIFACIMPFNIFSRGSKPPSDEQRSVELLRKARLMYPDAENDIEALDMLYQHVYREMLLRKKAGENIDALAKDLLLIWKEKDHAIKRTVEFESRYTPILTKQ